MGARLAKFKKALTIGWRGNLKSLRKDLCMMISPSVKPVGFLTSKFGGANLNVTFWGMWFSALIPTNRESSSEKAMYVTTKCADSLSQEKEKGGKGKN